MKPTYHLKQWTWHIYVRSGKLIHYASVALCSAHHLLLQNAVSDDASYLFLASPKKHTKRSQYQIKGLKHKDGFMYWECILLGKAKYNISLLAIRGKYNWMKNDLEPQAGFVLFLCHLGPIDTSAPGPICSSFLLYKI